MRLFSKALFCSLLAAALQTAAVSNVGAQATSDDNASKLSVPFNSEQPGSLQSQTQHTPSGQLYLMPPPAQPEKTFSGSIEVGVSATAGDFNNAKFREYQDPRNGAVINNFDFSVEH